MAVIDVQIQPHGRIRVLFDCSSTRPPRDDEVLIAEVIATARGQDGAPEPAQAD